MRMSNQAKSSIPIGTELFPAFGQKQVKDWMLCRLSPVYIQNLPFHWNPATDVRPKKTG